MADFTLTDTQREIVGVAREFGRDVLTRLIYGARIALFIGLASSFIGASAGAVLGVISAYLGGKTDLWLQRVMDIFLAFPLLILALAIVTVLGRSLPNLILAIAIPVIPRAARIVRASALSAKENVYVEAARAVGSSHLRVDTTLSAVAEHAAHSAARFGQGAEQRVVDDATSELNRFALVFRRVAATALFTDQLEDALSALGPGLDPAMRYAGVAVEPVHSYGAQYAVVVVVGE